MIIKFEGIPLKRLSLLEFNLLGPKAQRLINDIDYLRSYKIVDGVPEWEGMALIGPEDLLEAAKSI